MMKYIKKGARFELAATKKKKPMSTKWTAAEAAAVVASWKMLRQENLVAMSAGNASRD